MNLIKTKLYAVGKQGDKVAVNISHNHVDSNEKEYIDYSSIRTINIEDLDNVKNYSDDYSIMSSGFIKVNSLYDNCIHVVKYTVNVNNEGNKPNSKEFTVGYLFTFMDSTPCQITQCLYTNIDMSKIGTSQFGAHYHEMKTYVRMYVMKYVDNPESVTPDNILTGNIEHYEQGWTPWKNSTIGNLSKKGIGDVFNNLKNNIALEKFTHAEGDTTYAIYGASHAEGQNSWAIGTASHVEGDGAIAIGEGSHAEGYGNYAGCFMDKITGQLYFGLDNDIFNSGGFTNYDLLGKYSHAEGHNTRAFNDAEHASGKYNKSTPNYTLFSVGNGDSTTRKNAIEIDMTGNVYIPNLNLESYSTGNNRYLGYNYTTGSVKSEGSLQAIIGAAASKKWVTEKGYLTDASHDNTLYGRKNGQWIPVPASGGGTSNGVGKNVGNFSEIFNNYNLNTITGNTPYSHAEGTENTIQLIGSAWGGYNHVEGGRNKILSTRDNLPYCASHAEGWNNTIQANTSHVEGSSNIVYADNSHAEGVNNTINNAAIYGHAEGSSNTVNGNSAHAEGTSTIASGNVSHAEGSSSQATGSISHAEGRTTVASGNYSHAEGHHSNAIGDGSHAGGNFSSASGQWSFAHGDGTSATKNGEFATGIYNNNSSLSVYSCQVCGYTSDYISQEEFNNTKACPICGVSPSTHWKKIKEMYTIFSVGIGTDNSHRKNAIEIYNTGLVFINGQNGYNGTNPRYRWVTGSGVSHAETNAINGNGIGRL